VTPEKAMTDAVVGQDLWHSRFASSPAGRATALALLSVLRRDGYLLVSEAELATALHGLGPDSATPDCEHAGSFVPECEYRSRAIFAALVAAQEKGETGS
jgi:hypothetical protein